MTAQLPLPVGPAASVPVSVAASLAEDGDGGRVFVNGWLCFAWDCGDAAGRRLAAVQLVRIGAASQVQVAAAFGVNTSTVYRWERTAARSGMAGLLPALKGPKGPSKLTDAVVTDIRARRGAGATVAAIAAAVGVSVGSVCRVLAAAPGRGEDHAGNATDTTTTTTTTDASAAVAGADGGVGAVLPVLPVLPDAADRSGERVASRFGVIDYARPVFVPAARVPLAGLLLAIPALVATGLIGCAERIYGARRGFYGLASMLIEQVLRALAGEPRAEGATRINPTDLGRVLGLDRAPEVQTIRRVMRDLADRGSAAELVQAMARAHLAGSDDDTACVLYVDGHVRTYHGTRKIQKTHVSRLRFPAPATVETWINDAAGQPVWMVMAQPGASLASEIGRLLPDIRALVGDDRRVLVGFDRGGWSPALFKKMIAAGFDVLTWRKAPCPDVAGDLFGECDHVDRADARYRWNLADTTVQIPLDERKPALGTVGLRQITRLDDGGHQAHILTSRTDLAPAEIVYRMSRRWREENYFRYGRIHLALDAHDTYRVEKDDPTRMVPNPAKKQAFASVQSDRAALARAETTADRQLLALRSPKPGTATMITNTMHNAIVGPVIDAADTLQASKQAHKDTPARLPLGQVRPGQQVLDVETKILTHAIRMAAFNTQTVLARTITTDTGYARAADEAHTLIRTALTCSGDIDPQGHTLHVRLDPMNTPRATAAIAELCEVLNATGTLFPDTTMKLHYTVKPHTPPRTQY